MNETPANILLQLYRLEEYSECYELYRDLIKNCDDDFDEERETNLTAVLASLQMWDGKQVVCVLTLSFTLFSYLCNCKTLSIPS